MQESRVQDAARLTETRAHDARLLYDGDFAREYFFGKFLQFGTSDSFAEGRELRNAIRDLIEIPVIYDETFARGPDHFVPDDHAYRVLIALDRNRQRIAEQRRWSAQIPTGQFVTGIEDEDSIRKTRETFRLKDGREVWISTTIRDVAGSTQVSFNIRWSKDS